MTEELSSSDSTGQTGADNEMDHGYHLIFLVGFDFLRLLPSLLEEEAVKIAQK